ncbi:TetR family transcriptional regulator [Tsukamurella soli]|uniref:TetR family transcriptional regulator n=2 Tax=Tsukamurella soli TaxID=644556 RepID=A0ABP8JE83_9ACTN
MLPRDADATRARLVGAATAEFAECGIAGARVDRIAAAARANKAQIYHYFGSKQGLFAAVLSGYAERASASDYFDADDLPGTAAAIFDQFEENPELARLTTWYRLEAGGSDAAMPAAWAANDAKIAAIAAAQATGRVTDAMPASVLLGLMLTIATSWVDLPPEFASLERDFTTAERRGFVIEAVRRLIAV